ncbi:MAG: electron transporter RnfC, partial [Bacteroidales bacterium]|nr:electron transporter RnfC [Bacteroidales bacterium]
GLEPYLLMSLSELSEWEAMEKECIMNCIECGCCSYVCPSNRPLLDRLRVGKFKVGAIIRGRKNQ